MHSGLALGRRKRHLSAVLAAALIAGTTAAAALEVPYLASRVNDLAGLVPDEVESRIESQLETLEQATGAQVAVLTIPSLEGESLEDFSLRVAETWKLGRADVDDGALLLVARDDRKMRLEVGYGLESTLTDATSRRILDDVMRPRFRDGDFGGGIEAAVGTIANLIQGIDTLPPPGASQASGSKDMAWPARIAIFCFFLFVVGLFSMQAIFTRGCGAWFLYFFLMPFWGAFPFALLGAPVGLVFLPGWIIAFPILHLLLAKKDIPWLRSIQKSGWSSSSGWSGGGFSGGGGGFSGGGGSFGGGGSSSSW